MQSTRLTNRNLFAFHKLNKVSNSPTFINLPRWKKPILKSKEIDIIKSVISGIKSIELENGHKTNEIRTLSLEVKTPANESQKANVNNVKTTFSNSFYFEPENQTFRYKLERWFSLNWFIISSFLLLIASLGSVILLIFRT